MYKKLVNAYIERGFVRTDDKRCCCLDCILWVKKDGKYMDIEYWYQPINPDMVKCVDIIHTYYDIELFNTLNSYAIKEV